MWAFRITWLALHCIVIIPFLAFIWLMVFATELMFSARVATFEVKRNLIEMRRCWAIVKAATSPSQASAALREYIRRGEP